MLGVAVLQTTDIQCQYVHARVVPAAWLVPMRQAHAWYWFVTLTRHALFQLGMSEQFQTLADTLHC